MNQPLQIDVLEVNRTEKTVRDGLLALGAMYGDREPDAFFWKALITFSFRLFHLDAVEQGMALLSGVPVDYLRGDFLRQMEEDEGFYRVTRAIADKLVLHGQVAVPSLAVDRTKVNVQPVLGLA